MNIKTFRVPIMLAAAIVAVLFTITGPSATTVSAQEPPLSLDECQRDVQNGVFNKAECKALAVVGLDCYNDLVESLGQYAYRASNAAIHFANVEGESIACRELVALAGDCRDHQSQGPGTGPGVNPEADLNACAKWIELNFSSWSHVWADPEGRPGVVCNAVFGCGNYAVPVNAAGPPLSLTDVICEDFPEKPYCPEPVADEPVEDAPVVVDLGDPVATVQLLPPAAGSGGLASSVTTNPLALVALLLGVSLAGGAMGLGVALGGRALR
jgi:hypothetical protein